jgi:CHAT domain-containing protein/tetratricopeptide (TPR) repeat protein
VTRPFDRHLDSDEMDSLVSLQGTSVSGSEQLSQLDLREAKRHVESCQDCSQTLQKHGFVHSEILRMRAPNPSPPTPDCMGGAEWLEVAAGLLPEAKTRELMKHAAQCGHCGPLLKNAAEALVDEATPSEEALLASLQSARPEWRKNMAATLHNSVRVRQPRSSWWKAVFVWPAPAYAFAGIVTVAAVAWFGVRALHPPSAEQLLAQAYSEHRTIEMRIPGAKYSPIRIQRSATESSLNKSRALLKAEDLIGENLGKNPNDPMWLQAGARADLLDGNYDSAIKTIQRALQQHPDSPTLLTDLASAYYERAEATNRSIDYGYAVDALGQALASSPNDPIAIFNRAIVEEKLHLYNPAILDWQHYLELDPTGSWADEARKRLQATQEKVRTKESGLMEPLVNPAQLGAIPAQVLSEKLNNRVEDYLQEALERWLPSSIARLAGKQEHHNAATALAALAETLRTRHEDLWLSDVLSGPQGPSFDAAVLSLSAALIANDKGDYAAGRLAAQNASRLFHASGNLAAELRADAEEVYALHLLYNGQSCSALAESTISRLGIHKYEWLKAQINLERSNCFDLLAELGKSKEALDRGTALAKEHGFEGLYLRGVGFQSDASASLGSTQVGFSLASQGLELFWSSQIGLMKGYNLYTDLDTAADVLRLPYLQVALWNEATNLIDFHSDVVQRAMAHSWYGNAAYLANMSDLASLEFSKASALFASAPRSEATIRGKLDADIWLAGLATRAGDIERASALLTSVEENLQNAPGFAQEIAFYGANAELRLRRGDFVGCEAALRSAIFLAERARTSFSSRTARRQWVQQTSNAYRTLVAWKLRQGDPSTALEYWEWYKGSPVRSSDSEPSGPHRHRRGVPISASGNAPSLSVPTVVAEQLPILTNKVVIAYAVFPEGIASWAYNDRGISAQWIAKPERELRESTERFLRLCGERDSDITAVHSSAHELYDLLIAPVESYIGNNETVVIEPDGPLTGLPFEALIDGQGRYFLQRVSVVTSPGLYESIHAEKMPPIGPATPALIVSVPAVDDGSATPTSAADSEAETVAGQFSTARQLHSSSASLAEIRREIVAVRVFHFAGHAITSPESNGLLLNERDGKTLRPRLLNAESLNTEQLRGLQLAVLSACATGIGLSPGASGTENLTDAMLEAGVPDVVASRWNVDSEATRQLMNLFYRQLLAGHDVSSSLRAAQMELAAQPRMAHPYYWAAFGVQGI